MKPNNLTLYRQILLFMMTAIVILGVPGCRTGSKTSPPSPSETKVIQEEPTKEIQGPGMGPYDVAVIPLEAVPKPDPSRIWSYSFIEGEGKGLEVLRVVKDPRDIPLERFLYFNTPWQSSDIEGIPSGLVMHKNTEEITQRFVNDAHMAMAVYVHMSAGDSDEDDPLYVIDPHKDPWSEGDMWSPWGSLAVVDTESELRLPCMPQQIVDSGEAYRIPETDEEFDPSSYLPPKPWYPEIDPEIEPGEVREGWILCLAPNVPIEDVRIVSQSRERDEEEPSREYLLWTKLSGSQMGDWVLIEDIEVIGWQRPDDKSAQAYDDVPYARDEPDENSPVVYEGPVWISVTMGRTYEFGNPQVTSKRMKLNIQFFFDGMEDLLKEWDRMALKKTFNVDLYSDVTLNDRITTIPEVLVRAEDFWLNIVDVPGDMGTAWVKIEEREEPEVWRTIIPVWRLELIDSTEEITSTEDICVMTECYDFSKEVYDRSRGKFVDSSWEELDGQVPIIPFNQYALGVRIVGTTITDKSLFFSENGPELQILDPKYYQDHMMIVEIDSEHGAIGQLPYPNSWEVHCKVGEEIEYMGYLISKPLLGNLEGIFAISGLINSEIRAATRNTVLAGEIIGTCPVENILIFRFYTGPAWRLQ